MNNYYQLNTINERVIQFMDEVSKNGIKVVDDFWQGLSIEGIGAFLGALFAFIASMLTLWVEKTRARFIMHKNAIVTLEYTLNDHLNDISTNDFLIKHNINILRKGHLTYNRFSLLDLPQELELKLGDLTVINRYFSYRESIRRINADLNKINIGLDSINNYAVITGRTPSENFSHFVAQMESLNKYLNRSLLKETRNLLAFSRIYLRRINSLKYKGIIIYKLNNYKEISKSEIASELKKLEKEIEQTMKESKENTEEVLNDEKS